MSGGDGGRDAQRLLAFLSLPCATSFAKSKFSKLERSMTESISVLTERYLKRNLIEEVKLAYANDMSFEFEKWKGCVLRGEKFNGSLPSISASMDMGWQKRSSGMRYDSSSGHAFLVGLLTRKPIGMSLKSNFCRICSYHIKRNNIEPGAVPDHECLANHEGSAGSMESSALLEMVEYLFDTHQTSVATVITDDDSKMKCQCKWSNEDYLTHLGKPHTQKQWLIVGSLPVKKTPHHQMPLYRKGGQLRYPVPQPKFMADPAHRKKTFKNKLYLIKAKSVKVNHGIKDGDILRLTMYYGYFIRQLKDHPEDEWVDSAKAIVDHHFDSHEHCGAWCLRKSETQEQRSKSNKTYRDKTREGELYSILCDAIAPFISLSCLRELGHGANTNVNESLNNTISWFAPKNRTYSGSCSLRNRVGMAVSIHLVGHDVFYEDLINELGLNMDARFFHCLEVTQRERMKHLESSRTAKYKEKRRSGFFVKMKEYFEKLQAEKKRGEEYAPGTGFEENVERMNTTTTNIVVSCKRCGGIGHKTANHKMCKYHRSKLLNASSHKLLQASTEEIMNVENEKQGVISTGRDPRNIDNGSVHESVHDSPMCTETPGMTSGYGSLTSSVLSDITCTATSGTDSTREILGFDLLPEKMLGAVNGAVNDEILTTEEEQLSIVDSIMCSTDVTELDPEGTIIFTELLGD